MKRQYFQFEKLHVSVAIAFLCIVLILLFVPSKGPVNRGKYK